MAARGALEPSDDLLAAGPPLPCLRQLLTVPPAPEGADSLAFPEERRAHPEALVGVNLLLCAGPAGAVDNVEELYAAGLPRGLSGGLAGVAINHRHHLLDLVRRAQAAKQKLEDLVRSAANTKKQGATRSSGQHDNLRTGARLRHMAVPAGVAAAAAAAAAAAGPSCWAPCTCRVSA